MFDPRDYSSLPSFSSSPSLHFSPFSHFIHLQSAPCRSQTPNFYPSGVVSGHQLRVYRAALAITWSQLQQKERQWRRAYQRKPKALETQEKTTETETCSPQATVCACKVPGRVQSLLPGKILMPTNQIRAISPVHTYSANYVCVHFRHLGGI